MTKLCSFCYPPAVDGAWALQPNAAVAADWWQQTAAARRKQCARALAGVYFTRTPLAKKNKPKKNRMKAESEA